MIRRLIILLLIVGCVFAREYIAIIDFEGISVSEADAKALTQRLTSEMISLGVYQIVERSEMKRLLDEQKFQYSGCVDMKCAVEIGKMIGAKYMVVGSVSKVGSTYSIDSRLISVETGESYISATYSNDNKIDILLDDGMKSIAYQLSEINYEKQVEINKNIISLAEQNSINTTSDTTKWAGGIGFGLLVSDGIPVGSKSKNLVVLFDAFSYKYVSIRMMLGGKQENVIMGAEISIYNNIYGFNFQNFQKPILTGGKGFILSMGGLVNMFSSKDAELTGEDIFSVYFKYGYRGIIKENWFFDLNFMYPIYKYHYARENGEQTIGESIDVFDNFGERGGITIGYLINLNSVEQFNRKFFKIFGSTSTSP